MAPLPLLAAPMVLFAAATSDDWPQFRGPAGNAVAADARYPSTLDLEEGLAWRAEVPAGHASPIVVAGRVVVVGLEAGELVVACHALEDGRSLWRVAVAVEATERVHEVNSPCSSTPASDGSRVFVQSGSFGLLALALEDGAELWRRPLPPPENTFGSAASPVVAGDRLLFLRDTNGESFLEALDPATGEVLWRREREGFRSGWSTPVLRRAGDVTEVLVYGVGWLTAYDLADGAERWSVPGLTDEPITMPAVAGDLVLVTSYNMRSNPEVLGLPAFEELVRAHDRDENGALDLDEARAVESVLSRHDADGEGDHPLALFFRFLDADRDGELRADEWPRLVEWLDGMRHANGLMALRPPGAPGGEPELVWQDPLGVPECPSPLVLDGRVRTVKNGGLYSCLEVATGRVLHRGRIDSRGPHYASPVAADGKIYVASARGQVTILAATDELRVLARCDVGERILATPALAGGRVLVRGAQHLFAFGRADQDG